MYFYSPVSRIAVATAILLFATACTSDHVLNDNFPNGPVWVKKVEPAPEPVPEPEPEPEPEPSLAELNEKAVSAFEDQGFEAEITDKGVVVYLPPTIYFEDSKSDINLEARLKIGEIAQEVNKDYLRDREIEVSGHTDSVGDEAINLALSKKRAEAAASELVFSKVALTRMITRWYGESSPRLPEINADGTVNKQNRSLNRRVEFVVLNPQ